MGCRGISAPPPGPPPSPPSLTLLFAGLFVLHFSQTIFRTVFGLCCIFYAFLNMFSQRHHQLGWWAQICAAAGPFWNSRYLSWGQPTPKNLLTCKPNKTLHSNQIIKVFINALQYQLFFSWPWSSDFFFFFQNLISQSNWEIIERFHLKANY